MSALPASAPLTLAPGVGGWWGRLQASAGRRCRARVGAFGAAGALGAVLMLQAAASLLLRNSAFQDEALYLYAGRQILSNFRGGLAPKIGRAHV